jgi:pimeloyl-ACP methyl ester carboxylesterase
VDHKRLKLEHITLRPETRRYAVPLLLLHGAWHGAWCWRPAMEDFMRRGFEVHAVSLRGHGASDRPRSFNLCSLHDYVRDLATAVDSIHPRPIVIGHSMGGYVTQLYLMEQHLPRAVLLCSLPVLGALPFILRMLRRHPLATAQAFLTLNPRAMVGTPDLARDAFFRDTIAPAELERYSALIGLESTRVAIEASLTVRVEPARAATPMLVIAAEHDRVFTLDEQRATAAAYGAELLVVPKAAHDLMLDPSWPVAADAIERFAANSAFQPATRSA